MPTRQELKALSELRLKEAEALFGSGLYDGTVYLAGYVIELALKARICRFLEAQDYPDTGAYKSAYAVHSLDQLLFLAGLRSKLERNQAVLASWSIASPWKPEIRYQPLGRISRIEALVTLDAIRDPEKGILQWIKRYW